MQTTVLNLFRTQPPPKEHKNGSAFKWNRKVGIEVEVERGNTERIPGLKHWTWTGDGSLRYNGVEFVSYPISGVALEDALSELRGALTSMGAETSSRCSVHCHIDFSAKTMRQVMSFVTGFALFECILFSASGKDRYWNMYTPGLSSCYSQVQLAREINKAVSADNNDVPRLVDSWNKYSCINLRSLGQFGTVELRSKSGTVEVEEISEWICMLLQLAEYTDDKSCVDIINLAHDQQHLEVFPGVQYPYEFFSNNLCNAADIASAEE